MATIGTLLFTWIKGRQVGQDEFGNRYYEARRASADGIVKRWVLYRGMAEASKIPPHWHGWMHYTTDKLPAAEDIRRYDWQKPHLPNLTGTQGRYLPPGHLQKGGQRANSASGDYEAWNP
jgi:NADH:ubiquinone oxidoreductase subunit